MKKLRILADLRECQEGFSGIAVDTCRIFKIFNELETTEKIGGLLVGQDSRSFSKKLKISFDAPDSYLRQAEYLDALKVKNKNSLKQKILATTQAYLSSISPEWFFQTKFPLNPIAKKYYSDFIWQTHFAGKMDIDDYQSLLGGDFFGAQISYALAKVRATRLLPNPKIETKDWDIFFTSTPINLKVSKNTKKIVRYHDAIPLFYPHLTPNSPKEQYEQLKQCVFDRQTHFVCNSLNTLNELVTLFPEVEDRTNVISCSVSDQFYKTDQPLQIEEIINNYSCVDSLKVNESIEKISIGENQDFNHSFSKRYLICVSTIDPRKNYEALIQAWAEVRSTIASDLNLIIVGRVGWQSKTVLSLMSKYVKEGSLLHLTGVPFAELRSLLSHATGYVFPTLAEGFGIPPIEAMRCGCPTIVSSVEVMQETCGDASLFVNPYDIKEIAAAITRLIGDEPEAHSLRQDLIQKGYKQSEQYTISSCKDKWESYFESIM